MSDIDRESVRRQKELDIAALRDKSRMLEMKMRDLLQRTDGNSNYRNDIIWLAQEINSVNRQIKLLESNNAGRNT
jgi:hypothetical protein